MSTLPYIDLFWFPYLLGRCADKNGRPFQAVDEDRDEFLQECWVYRARNVMLEVIAQLSRCFNSEFDIWEEKRLGGS